MKLSGLTDEQVSKIGTYINDNDYYVDFLGESFLVYSMGTQYSTVQGISLELLMRAAKRPAPLTEEEKQLKHINKIHEQDIEHKRRIIANNEAKLKELRKKREGV